MDVDFFSVFTSIYSQFLICVHSVLTLRNIVLNPIIVFMQILLFHKHYRIEKLLYPFFIFIGHLYKIICY